MLNFLLCLLTTAFAQPIELNEANTSFLLGPIHPLSMAMAVGGAQMVAAQSKESYLVIWSPGGHLDPVLHASSDLQGLKNLHSITIMAMSGGAAISQVVGGHRYVVPRGQYMFHRVRRYLDGPITSTVAGRMADELQEADFIFAKLCYKRMNIGFKQYMRNVQEDWFLDASAALEVGAADSLQTFVCSEGLHKRNISVSTFNYITSVSTQTNFCDLLN